MTTKKLLTGVALAALTAGVVHAQAVTTFDAGSDFADNTIATEYTGALAGDLIVDFDFDNAGFNTLGAGASVQMEITLTNATFTGLIGAFTQDTFAGCAFGSPTFGGGVGGTVVRFESTGAIETCDPANAVSDATATLPIDVTTVGTDASATVALTALDVSGGSYTPVSDALDLLDYAQGVDWDITVGAAGAGLFEFDGDELDAGASGILGTLGGSLTGGVNSDLTTALAVAATIAASGTLLIEFPSGATGIGTVSTGFGACTQGAAPNDNQFSCALTGANLNTVLGAATDITITDDGDNANSATAQTPTATLSVTGNANYTPVNIAATAIQVVELDDGLDTDSPANDDFDWVRFGSGGTESNFRIHMDSAAEAARVTEVRIAVEDGNGITAPTMPAYFTLTAGTADTGFQVKGATITFNSRALGAAAGASGNANISSITLQYTEGTPVTALGVNDVLRQLVNRSPGSFVATPGLTND